MYDASQGAAAWPWTKKTLWKPMFHDLQAKTRLLDGWISFQKELVLLPVPARGSNYYLRNWFERHKH